MADHRGSKINPPIDFDTVASKHPDALGVAAQETINLERAIDPKASADLSGIPPGRVVTGAPSNLDKFNRSRELPVADHIFKHGLGLKP